MKRILGLMMIDRWMGRGGILRQRRKGLHGKGRKTMTYVSDTINEGVIGMESPTNPDPINDDYPIMDVTSNSLAHLNSGNNSQRADFSEQLEEIDKELLKFDNVYVSGVISDDNASKEDLGLQRVHSVTGLGEVGLHLNNVVAKEKNMTPKRG